VTQMRRCFCRCHNETRADQRQYVALGQLNAADVCERYVAARALVGTSVADVVEAATACSACRHKHATALTRPRRHTPR
jgi:hypothetical protein